MWTIRVLMRSSRKFGTSPTPKSSATDEIFKYTAFENLWWGGQSTFLFGGKCVTNGCWLWATLHFFFGICSTKGDSLTIHSTMGDFAGHLLGLTSPIPSPPSTLSPLLCPFSPSWKGGWKNLEFFFGFSAFCLLKSEPWNQSHLEFEINVGRFLLVCCLKRFFVEKTLSFFLGFHFCLLNQNHEIRNIPQLQLTCTRSNSPDIKNHFWKSLFSLKFLLLSFIARSFDFVLGPRISRSNEDVCGWKSSEQFRACLVFLVSLENFTYILEQVWNFEKLSRATQMFFFDLQNMCSILELELIWIVY